MFQRMLDIGGGSSGGVDVSDTTATEADVLDGKIFHLANGSSAVGTLEKPTTFISAFHSAVSGGAISFISDNKESVIIGYSRTKELSNDYFSVSANGNNYTITLKGLADCTVKVEKYGVVDSADAQTIESTETVTLTNGTTKTYTSAVFKYHKFTLVE